MSYKLSVEITLEEMPESTTAKESRDYGKTLMKFDVNYKNKDYEALKKSFLHLVGESDGTETG